MTSEDEARAWEVAADKLADAVPLYDYSVDDENQRGTTMHIRSVVVPHLRRRAARIRRGSKRKTTKGRTK